MFLVLEPGIIPGVYDIDIVFLSFPSFRLSGPKVFTRLTYSILIIIISLIVIIISGILFFALVELVEGGGIVCGCSWVVYR